MIVIRRLIWDSWNVAYIARHEVTSDEVEEVCHGSTDLRRTPSSNWTSSKRSYVSGYFGTY